MKQRLSRQRLRVLRAERELSQEAVAARAGLKPSRYWYLESANGVATDDEVKAIARVFRVPSKAIAIEAHS